MTTTASRAEAIDPALPGDLLIVERFAFGAFSSPYPPQFDVVEVVRAGRVGNVTQYQFLDFGGPVGVGALGYTLSLTVIPAGKVDKDGLVAAIREHRYPTAPHSPQIMPWSSMNEVLALVAKFARRAVA